MRHAAGSSPFASPDFPYFQWVKTLEQLKVIESAEIQLHCELMLKRPVFTVVVTGNGSPEAWKSTAAALRDQSYPDWHPLLLSSPSAREAFRDAPAVADLDWDRLYSDFVVFMGPGDIPASDFLYQFASELNRNPSSDLLYSDDDIRDGDGFHHSPFFKPGWSPDYLEGFDYIGPAACFRTSIAARCGPFRNRRDFTLRFTEKTARVAHVAKMLYHRPSRTAVPPEAGAEALRGRLERTGRQAEVVAREGGSHFEIAPRPTRHPQVSIVIPTNGDSGPTPSRTVNYVENCVASIRARSTYPAYEIVVAAGDGLSRATEEFLNKQGCRLVRVPGPQQGPARRLNVGASQASGEYLVLLSDACEASTPDWMERLLFHFAKPSTGVAGAVAIGEDGRVRQAGMIHHQGAPHHVSGGGPDDSGYFYSLRVARNFLGIAGTCCMTPARLYAEIGGYEERHLPYYQDIDYSLKVEARERTRICEPLARLFYYGPVPKGQDSPPQDIVAYQQIWRRRLGDDPYYNQRYLGPDPDFWKFSLQHARL